MNAFADQQQLAVSQPAQPPHHIESDRQPVNINL